MQLLDAVFMMVIDGEIDRREMELCQAIAIKLGFPSSVVPKLVIIEGIRKGQERGSVVSEVERIIG